MVRLFLQRGVIAMQLGFGRHFILAAFSVLALSGLLRAADPPAEGGKDLLDETRRRDQVAQQKVETDFRSALIEMSKLEYANPGRAAERLKKMLGVLDEDTVLRTAKREAWKRVVKDRIRVAEAEVERAAKEANDTAVPGARKDDRRAIDEQKARDEDKLKQEVKDIRRLQLEGNTDDAQRRAADLATRHPDSPAAAASRYMTGIAGARSANEALKAERGNRYLIAMRGVESSAMPPVDDIEFPSPAKWKEITKLRSKTQATDREKAILKALDSPVTVSFEGSTLEAVIDYLQTLSDQTIILDKKTLEDAGINYDTPINIRKMRNVSFRTVLRKVLGEVGLTYIVEKETIHVLRPEDAKKKMTVRTYYLGDLAGAADVTLGPAFSRLVMAQTVRDLIQMVVGTIDEDSWKVNNPEAAGTIFFDPRTLTLIVKQSAEIHYMLGGFGGR